MPELERRGHHTIAISLRGHGGSQGRIRGASIADYVEDVHSVASTLEVPPVVIGQSMGGYTTQHYLARGHRASAVVLVSPVPRRGAWGATWRVARRHPLVFAKANLTLDIGPIVETEALAREFLVAPGTPREVVAAHMDRIERASYRTYWDMLFRRPELSGVDIPALVVGGDNDAFFTVEEWEDTAQALGAELVVIDGMGHQPMWEGEGRCLVEEIDRFVTGLSL